MLRLMLTLLTAAVAVQLFSCAQKQASATDLMAHLLGSLDHPEMQIYFDGAAEEGDGWLSDTQIEALYGGHSPVSLAEQYSIALCKADRIYEIHLFNALNTTAADQIEELLRGRLEQLQQKGNYLYDADSFAATGIVWKRGRWVCLLVTEDNALAKALLKERI